MEIVGDCNDYWPRVDLDKIKDEQGPR